MKTASTANGVTTTLLDQKGYDPRGRLTREWHSINGGTPVLVSSITYDEMERMSTNALGNSIVTTAFTYDIQNRLRKINDPANIGTKPFAMEMQYNSPDVSGATAQFAGNISAARWIQQGASGQTYYYNYDSYSRMTGGIHGGGNNEQSIDYDSNGNINALTRMGTQAAGLNYTYSGNRLTSLTKDGTGYSYAYDSNGNTTTDGLRGMTIAYNYLNLPNTVTKGSDVLTYIYDAAGGKLAEKLNSTVNNFYTGAIVYKGDKTIDYIQTSTGIVRKVGADFIRQYNISDHLGNTRSIVNQSGTIEQATDYYPYGLAFSYNNLDKNRYLYNGKELQNQTLATTFFGVHDYGARYYDPVTGRWNSVDPMGEDYYEFSPFVYTLNNPMRYTDPTGMQVKDSTVVRTLDPVVVTASKPYNANPFLGTLAFSLYSFSWYGKQANYALGNPNASLLENIEMSVAFLTALLVPMQNILNVRNASFSKTGGKLKIATKPSVQGFKSLGAAGKNFSKVLQPGGQSLTPKTLKALNLTKEQGRNAIHALKSELRLPNNFHGKIMGNGDYLHPSTGDWLGNLFDYVY